MNTSFVLLILIHLPVFYSLRRVKGGDESWQNRGVTVFCVEKSTDISDDTTDTNYLNHSLVWEK